ncbi:MAG TPA: hypothetical protein VMR86_15145 [Myxococcota bacterium]|nr:hypothetical protein [Myxococcota bacterium]
MVGGFNTNIRYRGHIFHVQTEDGGKESPSIITLLYSGGAILFSKKTSYANQVKGAADSEAVVRQLMEAQHSAMVQALKSGKLDDKLGLVSPDAVTNPSAGVASPAAEFGAGVITRRTLDEVILSHLNSR